MNIRGLLAATCLALSCAAPAGAQEQTARSLVEGALSACFAIKDGGQVSLPAGFAPGANGSFVANAEGATVTIVAAVEDDPDLDIRTGACQIGISGDVPWFAAFSLERYEAMKADGWDTVEAETGLRNNTQRYALSGRGSVKFFHGVGAPNAFIAVSWVE